MPAQKMGVAVAEIYQMMRLVLSPKLDFCPKHLP
ncbi:hypothetical protein KYE_01893 [Marinobacter manganoxydans MnI7-9]|uniref:Uncharacterized protein n=1 Tax=Marinobacter manganoxydans MnI7-9 TaxID=1094979 RepID=G6YNG4_9GAMM|nr:hypothetical protein KYE_01893 [Marinobacter manganoxydans MnI7-9]